MNIKLNEFLALMRKRQSIKKEDFLNISGYALSLSHIETGKQFPRVDTLRDFLDVLKIPADQFFRPYLKSHTYSVYRLQSSLVRTLDYGDMQGKIHPMAKNLFSRLEACEGFEESVSRQLILSLKARLFLQLGKPTEEILPLIYEGVAISYPEFDANSFGGAMLVFEEPELLCSLAKVFAVNGDLPAAIKLLKNIQSGIDKLPIDIQAKEDKLAPILFTLAKFQTQNGDYKGGVETCTTGKIISLRSTNGKFTPDFLLFSAECFYGLGDVESCRNMLRLAFFGFALLHNKEKVQQVLVDGRKRFGVTFKTYGVENFDFKEVLLTGYKQEEFPGYENIGELIRNLRKAENISQAELCEGICSDADLSRIESGKIAKAKPWVLEALMQRLGRDIGLYISTFYSAEDYENKQLKEEVRHLTLALRRDEAQKYIDMMESKESFQSGINLQSLLSAKASIKLMASSLTKANEDSTPSDIKEYKDMLVSLLHEAIKITRPNFKEEDIAHYRLTHNEITIISNLALGLVGIGETSHGFNMYERLRTSINRYYVDEVLKSKVYPGLMYNFALFYWELEEFEESLEANAEAEALALRSGEFILLQELVAPKANALYSMGRKPESLSYFALAYFGHAIGGESKAFTLEEIQNDVKSKFGFQLE